MLVILCGKSGSGKTALANYMTENHGWHKIVTYTTRKRRPEEIDGYDYHFVSNFRFFIMERLGLFMETKRYTLSDGTNVYYGSPSRKIANCKPKDHKLIILTPKGYQDFLAKNYDIEYKCVYLYAHESILRRRLQIRGSESDDEITRRLYKDEADFDGFKDFNGVHMVTNNGSKSFEQLAHEIASLK